MDSSVLLAIGGGAVAVLFAVVLIVAVLRQPPGNARMIEIAAAIQEGASAYLNRQYIVVAVIGGNVGDCAGMAADLFETYAVTMVAAMLLGALLFKDVAWIVYPLLLGATSIVGSVVGALAVRLYFPKWIMGGLYAGLIVAAVIA